MSAEKSRGSSVLTAERKTESHPTLTGTSECITKATTSMRIDYTKPRSSLTFELTSRTRDKWHLSSRRRSSGLSVLILSSTRPSRQLDGPAAGDVAREYEYLKNLQRRLYFLHISLVQDSSGGCSTHGHDNKISNTATLPPFFLKIIPRCTLSLGEPADILLGLLGPHSTLLPSPPFRASLRLWWRGRDLKRSLRLTSFAHSAPFYRVACYVLFCFWPQLRHARSSVRDPN